MMLRIGDRVRATEVTELPYQECGPEMLVDGVVVQFKLQNGWLILENWQGREVTCFQQGATILNPEPEDIVGRMVDSLRKVVTPGGL